MKQAQRHIILGMFIVGLLAPTYAYAWRTALTRWKAAAGRLVGGNFAANSNHGYLTHLQDKLDFHAGDQDRAKFNSYKAEMDKLKAQTMPRSNEAFWEPGEIDKTLAEHYEAKGNKVAAQQHWLNLATLHAEKATGNKEVLDQAQRGAAHYYLEKAGFIKPLAENAKESEQHAYQLQADRFLAAELTKPGDAEAAEQFRQSAVHHEILLHVARAAEAAKAREDAAPHRAEALKTIAATKPQAPEIEHHALLAKHLADASDAAGATEARQSVHDKAGTLASANEHLSLEERGLYRRLIAAKHLDDAGDEAGAREQQLTLGSFLATAPDHEVAHFVAGVMQHHDNLVQGEATEEGRQAKAHEATAVENHLITSLASDAEKKSADSAEQAKGGQTPAGVQTDEDQARSGALGNLVFSHSKALQAAGGGLVAQTNAMRGLEYQADVLARRRAIAGANAGREAEEAFNTKRADELTSAHKSAAEGEGRETLGSLKMQRSDAQEKASQAAQETVAMGQTAEVEALARQLPDGKLPAGLADNTMTQYAHDLISNPSERELDTHVQHAQVLADLARALAAQRGDSKLNPEEQKLADFADMITQVRGKLHATRTAHEAAAIVNPPQAQGDVYHAARDLRGYFQAYAKAEGTVKNSDLDEFIKSLPAGVEDPVAPPSSEEGDKRRLTNEKPASPAHEALGKGTVQQPSPRAAA